MGNDFATRLEEARRRLPLKRLMEQRSRGPENGNWKAFAKCPYCNKKGAGVFPGKRGDLFKCHHTSCPSGTAAQGGAWDEVGFLAYELGLSRQEAAITLLKEAGGGLWEEREKYAPSIMPGKSPRKRRMPRTDQPTEEDLASGDEPETNLPSAEAGPTSPDTAPPSTLPSLTGPDAPAGKSPGSSTDAEGAAAVPPAAGLSADANSSPDDAASVPGEESLFANPKTEEGPTEAGTPNELSGPAEVGTPNAGTPNGPPGGPPTEPPMPPPPPGGETPGPPAPPPRSALGAMRRFYEQLVLTEEDKHKLWLKRGLTPEWCEALGLRSSLRTNLKILIALKEEFPIQVLLDACLWVESKDDAVREPQPNLQYAGWGVIGKSKDNPDEWDWGWTLPILIPYLDEAGDLIDLRAHKRTQKGQLPRLYVPRVVRALRNTKIQIHQDPNKLQIPSDGVQERSDPLEGAHPSIVRLFGPQEPMSAEKGSPYGDRLKPGLHTPAEAGTPYRYAVITEGEFKAAALFVVLGADSAVAALPGVGMAKPLFGDVEDWLEGLGVRQVIVAHDNEEKGDPKLPSYKEEARDRYDTEAWARYLGECLEEEGYDAKVGHLPDAWRDEKGKADWDGALALLIRQAWAKIIPKPQDRNPKVTAKDVWEMAQGKVRVEFLRVISEAARVVDMKQLKLFDWRIEQLINDKVSRWKRSLELPIGGKQEEIIQRRLQRLARKLKTDDERLPGKYRAALSGLAKRYSALEGRYYILRELREATAEKWQDFLRKAHGKEDVEVKRACELMLLGMPIPISDFYMKAQYVLKKVNGKRERMVTLHNIHGANSDPIALNSAAFAQPSKFREWLLDESPGATWSAGEREINRLQADVAAEVSKKEVIEVALRGYDEESKLWFFGDVAYTPEGKEVFPKTNGVIWHKGKGYRLAEEDVEGEEFVQPEPMMHPNNGADDGHVKEIFEEASARFFETVGGFSGYQAMGGMFSYGAAPELYRAYNAFPGQWVHGEPNQGKSSLSRWEMRIWGFTTMESGMMLPDSTKVGLSILLQQYGNLPVWVEEFQPNCPDWMLQKIKGAYNRESGGKKSFGDAKRRKIRTSMIITGVATCPETQVRSRYPHVQVAEANRLEDHYDWFEEHSPNFYLLGRYIMRNRPEFARQVLETMRKWVGTKPASVDARSWFVSGVSYAAFAVLADMLKAHVAKRLQGFREFLIGHSAHAAQEVRQQVNVSLFWSDVLSALKSDAFGETPSDRRRVFKVVEDKKATLTRERMSEKQWQAGSEDTRRAWRHYRLYFIPDPVIDMLRRYKRTQGKELPLDKGDLRAQMKVHPGWVEAEVDSHRQRFHGQKTTQVCWCIDLTTHELGYRQVSDAEFEESFKSETGEWLAREDWADPRKGELFALVDSLAGKEEA